MNNQEKDDAVLAQNIRQALDEQHSEPDELTRAALRAARYRALDHMPAESEGIWSLLRSRWAMAAGGAACAVLLAWGLQTQTPQTSLEVASNQAEDAAVIADLDLVMWLEEGDV